MQNSNKAVIALIIAMLCISAIFLYSSTVEPVVKAPGEITSVDEGKLVTSQGLVNSIRTGRSSLSFDLVDPATGDRVQVFISSWMDPPPQVVHRPRRESIRYR